VGTPLPAPTIAYVVRPVGDGPFPLAIMNHGVSLDPVQRGFFPLIEFRDAATWFALHGGSPLRSRLWRGRYRRAGSRPLHRVLFQDRQVQQSELSGCRACSAQLNLWIIEYMSALKRVAPDNVIVIGQSAGG
jgi:dienelactone hydrolase